MAFEFVCPYCHTRTKVHERYLGQTGPCVNCGRMVAMPVLNEKGVLVQGASTPARSPNDKKSGVVISYPVVIAGGVVLVFLGLSVIMGILMWPQLQQRIERIAQTHDVENMRTIAKALNAYNDQYGTYPPPAVVDDKGKKLYSWRVLILPFLGYETLYDRYQKNQAWDSPANIGLLKEMPREFASPNSQDALALYESNYSLVTGNGTLFPLSGPLDRKTISDRPTLLLVETSNGTAVWTEPADIDASRGLKVGSKPNVEAGGLYQKVFMGITVDEEPMRIPKETPQNVLDSLVSPNGNEKLDVKSFFVE